mgnify:CR=1 FL=1
MEKYDWNAIWSVAYLNNYLKVINSKGQGKCIKQKIRLDYLAEEVLSALIDSYRLSTSSEEIFFIEANFAISSCVKSVFNGTLLASPNGIMKFAMCMVLHFEQEKCIMVARPFSLMIRMLSGVYGVPHLSQNLAILSRKNSFFERELLF